MWNFFASWLDELSQGIIDTFNIIRDHSQFSEDEFTNSMLGEGGKIVCMLIFVVLGLLWCVFIV